MEKEEGRNRIGLSGFGWQGSSSEENVEVVHDLLLYFSTIFMCNTHSFYSQ